MRVFIVKFKTTKIGPWIFRPKTIWIWSKLFCVHYSFCNVLKRRPNFFGTFLNLLVISIGSHWNSPLSCQNLWVHLNRDYGKCIYRKCINKKIDIFLSVCIISWSVLLPIHSWHVILIIILIVYARLSAISDLRVIIIRYYYTWTFFVIHVDSFVILNEQMGGMFKSMKKKNRKHCCIFFLNFLYYNFLKIV